MPRTQTPAIAHDNLEIFRGKETPDKSFRWYVSQVQSIRALGTYPQAVQSPLGHFTPSTGLGDMYLFVYDPKLKDTLPYYDTYPLVIPFSHTPEGFTGLNLHYLPPMLRMGLLNRLMEYTTDTRLTPQTRFRLKWTLLKQVSQFPGAAVCVKQYLNGHVRSRMFKINPQDWRKTILLPLQHFHTRTAKTVHRHAVRHIRTHG